MNGFKALGEKKKLLDVSTIEPGPSSLLATTLTTKSWTAEEMEEDIEP